MIGPKGLERVVNSLRMIAPELPFPIVFHELTEEEERIPFEITANCNPNARTKAAMLEAERIARDPNVKGYTDIDELFKELKS